MRALALVTPRTFEIFSKPDPIPKANEIRVRPLAAGICGTDFHIYDGLANYHRDPNGIPVSLELFPQVLGHEFTGVVEATGPRSQRFRAGDRVLIDQVLNCYSRGRSSICEFCESGDCHQCLFAQEIGITGLDGAFAEMVCVPECNALALPPTTDSAKAALAEPLACVIHAQDRIDQARTRYTWDGPCRIRHVVVLGAGPSGLLFVQYMRRCRRFSGEIFVLDSKPAKLQLARDLGAHSLIISTDDVAGTIRGATRGEGVQYIVEATGNGNALDWIPTLASRQATLSLYGAGHGNLADGCLTPIQSMELSVVTSSGASGHFSLRDGPEVYKRALALIEDGTIDVAPLISHRYEQLERVPLAFSTDRYRDDFIKGVYVPNLSGLSE